MPAAPRARHRRGPLLLAVLVLGAAIAGLIVVSTEPDPPEEPAEPELDLGALEPTFHGIGREPRPRYGERGGPPLPEVRASAEAFCMAVSEAAPRATCLEEAARLRLHLADSACEPAQRSLAAITAARPTLLPDDAELDVLRAAVRSACGLE